MAPEGSLHITWQWTAASMGALRLNDLQSVQEGVLTTVNATTRAAQAPWTMGWHPAALAALGPWTGAGTHTATPWLMPQQMMPMAKPAQMMPMAGKPAQMMPMAGKPAQMMPMAGKPGQTLPAAAVSAPGAITSMAVPGAAGQWNVAPAVTGFQVPETQGAWRVPGFNIAVDSPLLQGGLSWPGVQGMLNWPGLQSMLQLPGLGLSGKVPDAQAAIRWPGFRAVAEPDTPAGQ